MPTVSLLEGYGILLTSEIAPFKHALCELFNELVNFLYFYVLQEGSVNEYDKCTWSCIRDVFVCVCIM